MKKFILTLAVTVYALLSAECFAAPAVNVRAGVHDTYNRLVFDWTKPVRYTMNQESGHVSVQFNAPATANFKPALAVKTPLIRGLRQSEASEGLSVSFQIPNGARVQAFADGNKIAFDVLPMKKGPITFDDKPQPALAEKDVVTGPQKPEVVIPSPEVVKTDPAKVIPRPQTLADVLEGKTTPPPAKETEAVAETLPEKGTIIAFTPDKLTRLAAFRRAGRLWIVIDQAQTDLVPQIHGEQAGQFNTATRIDLKDATGFVLDIPASLENAPVSIKRDGAKWMIWFDPSEKPYLPAEIPVNATDKEKSDVTFYAGEQPKIINAKDSQLGDRLWIVPMRAPDGRINQPRVTPSYQMLSSYIGAIIAPMDDNLRIAAVDDLVTLSASGDKNIVMSNEKDRQKGAADAVTIPAFRFGKIRKEGFTPDRQDIEQKIAMEKSPAKKQKLVLDLARLYIENGFGPEAMGLLRVLKGDMPAIEKNIEYRALRGVASSLSGDTQQAEQDLTGEDLQYQPIARLWLGYAYARDNQWSQARNAFIESGNSEATLPENLRARLILAKAETALQANDIASAEMEMKKIKDTDALSASEKAAYDYIRATTLVIAGKKATGLEMYQELMRGPDQLYRAKAELEYVGQALAKKNLTQDEAIERLEGLRYSWRGDRLEVQILRQLGQYYIDKKDYMQALTLWRQAASLSQNADDTDAVTQQMQTVFRSLYVDGKADDLNPLRALAVFDRFRELTPSGEDGYTAQKRLAMRLASIDLLDQADSLMETLLLNQANGQEAVEIGARLANIRLLNKNPSGALKALDESHRDSVSDEKLQQRRLILRARALADTGRADDALSLLNSDQFPQGLSLKADILWRQNRWSEAVVILQQLASRYRDEGQNKVDGPLPGLVMKMAIALTLDDNLKGIELLIASYGDYMATTKNAENFKLITQPSRGSNLADLETLRKQVGEVELYEQFLKNFDS